MLGACNSMAADTSAKHDSRLFANNVKPWPSYWLGRHGHVRAESGICHQAEVPRTVFWWPQQSLHSSSYARGPRAGIFGFSSAFFVIKIRNNLAKRSGFDFGAKWPSSSFGLI